MAAPTTGTPTVAVLASSSSPQTLTVNVPTHSAGDLLIAVAYNSSSHELTPPSGWIEFYEQTVTVTVSFTVRAWYRIASGSEPASYDWGLPAFCAAKCAIVPISGAADPAANSIEAEYATDATGGTVTSPSITPSDNDSLVLRVAIGAQSSGSFTPPAGHTEILDDGTTAASMAIVTITANASATGTADFGQSPSWHSQFICVALAIAPEAGGTFQPAWAIHANQ